LTPPDPQLKGAWYPGGFNPCTYHAKNRFQSFAFQIQNLHRYDEALVKAGLMPAIKRIRGAGGGASGSGSGSGGEAAAAYVGKGKEPEAPVKSPVKEKAPVVVAAPKSAAKAAKGRAAHISVTPDPPNL
jgi:hypothetical protein